MAAIVLILVVAVTVALGIVVTLAERGLRQGSARAADPFDLLVGARGSATQLVLTTVYLQPALLELMPGAALRDLATDSGVVYATPLIFGDSYKGFPVVGSTVDFLTEGGRVAL